MHYAALTQSASLTKQLLAKGSQLTAQDNKGRVPLEYAKEQAGASSNSAPTSFDQWELGASSAKTVLDMLHRETVKREMTSGAAKNGGGFLADLDKDKAPVMRAHEETGVADISDFESEEEDSDDEEELAEEIQEQVEPNDDADDEDNEDDGFGDLKNATKEEWLALGFSAAEYEALNQKKAPTKPATKPASILRVVSGGSSSNTSTLTKSSSSKATAKPAKTTAAPSPTVKGVSIDSIITTARGASRVSLSPTISGAATTVALSTVPQSAALTHQPSRRISYADAVTSSPSSPRSTRSVSPRPQSPIASQERAPAVSIAHDETLRTEAVNLKQKLADQEHRYDKLEKHLEEVEAMAASKGKLVEMLGMQIETQRKAIRKFETERAAAVSTSLGDAQRTQELNAQVAELQQTTSQLHQQLEDASKANEQLESQRRLIDQLREELAAHSTRAPTTSPAIDLSHDEELQHLKDTLAAAQRQLSTELHHRARAEEDAQDMRFKLEELLDNMKESEVQLQQERTKTKQFEERVHALENIKKSARISGGNDDVAALKSRIQSLEANNHALSESLAESKQLCDKERRTNQILSEKLESLGRTSNAGSDAIKQEVAMRMVFEDKCLKLQGELELVRKELGIERSSAEAQRRELALLRNGTQTDSREYVDLLRAQVDEERTIRQKMEADHAKTLRSLENSEKCFVDIQRHYEEEMAALERLRTQKSQYENSLLRADQEVATIQSKLDELAQLVTTTKSELHAAQQNNAQQAVEIQVLHSKQEDLRKTLDARHQEMTAVKDELHNTASALAQERATNKDARRESEQQLATLTRQRDTFSAKLDATTHSLTNLKKLYEDLHTVDTDVKQRKQVLETELARTQEELRNVSLRLADAESQLTERIALIQELVSSTRSKDDEIKSQRERITDLDQSLATADAEAQAGKRNIAKLEETSLQLNDRIAALQSELQFKDSQLNEVAAARNIYKSEKDGVRDELLQLELMLNDERNNRALMESRSAETIAELESSLRKIVSTFVVSPNENNEEEQAAAAGGDYAKRLSAAWTEVDSHIDYNLRFAIDTWRDLAKRIEPDSLGGATVQRSLTAIADMFEKSTLARIHVTLSRVGTRHHSLNQKWQQEFLGVTSALKSTTSKLHECEQTIADLNVRLPTIERVNRVEQENLNLAQLLKQSEEKMALMMDELKDSDTDLAATYELPAPLLSMDIVSEDSASNRPSFRERTRDSILALKHSITNGSDKRQQHADDSADLKQFLLVRKTSRRKKAAEESREHVALTEQIAALRGNIARIEEEIRHKEQAWSKTRESMESAFAGERASLQTHLRTNEQTIARLTADLRTIHEGYQTASKMSEKRDFQLLVDKLDRLRKETDAINAMHAENMKILRQSHDAEMGTLLKEVRELKKELELSLIRSQVLRNDNLKLKDEIAELKDVERRNHLAKAQIESTLAEMKVLVKPWK